MFLPVFLWKYLNFKEKVIDTCLWFLTFWVINTFIFPLFLSCGSNEMRKHSCTHTKKNTIHLNSWNKLTLFKQTCLYNHTKIQTSYKYKRSDIPVMKSRKSYSLNKDLWPFLTGTSIYGHTNYTSKTPQAAHNICLIIQLCTHNIHELSYMDYILTDFSRTKLEFVVY